MTNVKFFHPGSLEMKFSERGSSLHPMVDRRHSQDFAAGVVNFRDANFEWKLWYDEVLICVNPGDSFEVIVDGKNYPMQAGDAIWMPRDTVLTYRSIGLATLYYVVAPADFEDRKKGNE